MACLHGLAALHHPVVTRCWIGLQLLLVLLITTQVSYKYTHGTFSSTVEKFHSSLCNNTLPLHCDTSRPLSEQLKSRECLCNTPTQFDKFVLFYCDGLAHDLSERFKLLPLLRNHSNTYLIFTTGFQASYAVMTTYLTGKVMSNYDGSPILTDNLIWQMAKKGNFSVKYEGAPMPFHDVIRSQASSERLLVSATDDFSVELARKILFPWVFGTESTAEEDVKRKANEYLDSARARGWSLFLTSNYVDHADHITMNKYDADVLKVIEAFGNNFKHVKDWVDRHPEYLLVLCSDHGGPFPGDGSVSNHGASRGGNEPYLAVYNPRIVPDKEQARWLNTVDFAPTFAQYLRGVNVPAESVGVVSPAGNDSVASFKLRKRNALQLRAMADELRVTSGNSEMDAALDMASAANLDSLSPKAAAAVLDDASARLDAYAQQVSDVFVKLKLFPTAEVVSFTTGILVFLTFAVGAEYGGWAPFGRALWHEFPLSLLPLFYMVGLSALFPALWSLWYWSRNLAIFYLLWPACVAALLGSIGVALAVSRGGPTRSHQALAAAIAARLWSSRSPSLDAEGAAAQQAAQRGPAAGAEPSVGEASETEPEPETDNDDDPFIKLPPLPLEELSARPAAAAPAGAAAVSASGADTGHNQSNGDSKRAGHPVVSSLPLQQHDSPFGVGLGDSSSDHALDTAMRMLEEGEAEEAAQEARRATERGNGHGRGNGRTAAELSPLASPSSSHISDSELFDVPSPSPPAGGAETFERKLWRSQQHGDDDGQEQSRPLRPRAVLVQAVEAAAAPSLHADRVRKAKAYGRAFVALKAVAASFAVLLLMFPLEELISWYPDPVGQLVVKYELGLKIGYGLFGALWLWSLASLVADWLRPARAQTRALRSRAEFGWLLAWRLGYLPCFFIIAQYEFSKLNNPDAHYDSWPLTWVYTFALGQAFVFACSPPRLQADIVWPATLLAFIVQGAGAPKERVYLAAFTVQMHYLSRLFSFDTPSAPPEHPLQPVSRSCVVASSAAAGKSLTRDGQHGADAADDGDEGSSAETDCFSCNGDTLRAQHCGEQLLAVAAGWNIRRDRSRQRRKRRSKHGRRGGQGAVGELRPPRTTDFTEEEAEPEPASGCCSLAPVPRSSAERAASADGHFYRTTVLAMYASAALYHQLTDTFLIKDVNVRIPGVFDVNNYPLFAGGLMVGHKLGYYFLLGLYLLRLTTVTGPDLHRDGSTSNTREQERREAESRVASGGRLSACRELALRVLPACCHACLLPRGRSAGRRAGLNSAGRAAGRSNAYVSLGLSLSGSGSLSGGGGSGDGGGLGGGGLGSVDSPDFDEDAGAGESGDVELEELSATQPWRRERNRDVGHGRGQSASEDSVTAADSDDRPAMTLDELILHKRVIVWRFSFLFCLVAVLGFHFGFFLLTMPQQFVFAMAILLATLCLGLPMIGSDVARTLRCLLLACTPGSRLGCGSREK